jgi:probable addiction module antidote protein
MAIVTEPFDASKYLDTPDLQALYLADLFETGDHALIAHGLGVVAKARGMTSIARDSGLQRESLYKALSMDGKPELATVLRVLKAMGLHLTVQADTPA